MSKFISDKLKSLFKSAPAAAVTAEAMKPSVVTNMVGAAQKLMAPLKPHHPSIKFRKAVGTAANSGSHQIQSVQATATTAPKFAAPAAAGAGKVSTIALPTIEDWQLPHRYRRRPLDQEEIDYINRGGPA